MAERPAGGLARRRGFRSGFSRQPADPTEPDDGQPWPRAGRRPCPSGAAEKRGSSSEPPPSGRERVVSRTAARIITYPLRQGGLRKRPIAQTALCPPNRDEPFDSLHIPARARGALAR